MLSKLGGMLTVGFEFSSDDPKHGGESLMIRLYRSRKFEIQKEAAKIGERGMDLIYSLHMFMNTLHFMFSVLFASDGSNGECDLLKGLKGCELHVPFIKWLQTAWLMSVMTPLVKVL